MRMTFGDITLLGASHSPFVGVDIANIPAGIRIGDEDFEQALSRRRSGAKGTTPRREADLPLIERGIAEGVTTGATIRILFANNDTRPADYSRFESQPRPGHADYVSRIKYGKVFPGGGIFSGRMTLPLVAASVVLKAAMPPSVSICAQLERDENFDRRLDAAIAAGDSIGATVRCECRGVPAGLGEPFFDSLEGTIARLVFAIPGVRGIEFGDGFAASAMLGSSHNDPIVDAEGHTSRNGAGGINGGISNGNPIVFRVAFKPTSSISREQRTFDFSAGEVRAMKTAGRHDACFALRTPPVVEAAATIALWTAMHS